ncbi:hypothetical protein VPH95E331_0084 [Vibrio phage 95E33-1]|nr:hypothetical protein MYOV022v2_p0069 [Vibrio phage 12E28.1]QZI90238.1 hypothetical protein MYOV021v2_p0069 [Vibrio phage 18E29.1]QZI90604.1 hypothetical protein MYOV023v1_p0057 [Vibrio phage 91E28.1a]QZI90647.1 hypothetical protein MYOV020v1_p0021 [Vibrio phage 98E28.6a]
MENMTELERKFIMMSRIAMQLAQRGLIAGATHYGDFCAISVQCSKTFTVLEDVNSFNSTEQELLNWWSAIEG